MATRSVIARGIPPLARVRASGAGNERRLYLGLARNGHGKVTVRADEELGAAQRSAGASGAARARRQSGDAYVPRSQGTGVLLPLDEPCHGDVLALMANGGDTATGTLDSAREGGRSRVWGVERAACEWYSSLIGAGACEGCGELLTGWRSDARWCSERCRSRARPEALAS